MRIECPICGERDLREFQYLGSAKLLDRPDPATIAAHDAQLAAFHDYVHLRDNLEGENEELWLHETGCRAWLFAIRDTKTHVISKVALARDIKKERG